MPACPAGLSCRDDRDARRLELLDDELGEPEDDARGAGRVGHAGGRREVLDRPAGADEHGPLAVEGGVEVTVAEDDAAGEDHHDRVVVGEARPAGRAVLGGVDLALDELDRSALDPAELGVDVLDRGSRPDGCFRDDRLGVGVADADRFAGGGTGRAAGVLDRPGVDVLLGHGGRRG